MRIRNLKGVAATALVLAIGLWVLGSAAAADTGSTANRYRNIRAVEGDAGGGERQYRRGFGGFANPEFWPSLTDEELNQARQLREKFFADTEDLRLAVHQKRLELKSELARKDPDRAKAIDIQKALSGLKGDLGLKRLEYRLELKKIHPALGMEPMRGKRGGGRGQGHRRE